MSPPIDLPELDATDRDALEYGVRRPAPALISDDDLCANAADLLAERGWSYRDGVFAVHYPSPGRGSMTLPFPRATDALQKHLSFLGHVADAIDATRLQVFSNSGGHSVAMTASSLSPVHFDSDPDSLSRAALLALAGRGDV